MSNLEATKLYEAIIEEVISDSRQDFEDSGIDESTLQDLKKIWREKLTNSQVAKFSWDDEDQLNDHVLDNHLSQNTGLQDDSLNLDGSDIQIPMSGDSQLSYNTVQPTSNPGTNFGIQLPTSEPQPKSEYNDSTGLMLPRINQADGTFELTIETDKVREIMNNIKTKNKNKLKQTDGAVDEDEDDDKDLFNDSDDINSDLDDELDSEKSDDEEGDQEGQIMLCLYDKVQRVKNKWKSNLKEGVANINGRDYVFQKATGESEW